MIYPVRIILIWVSDISDRERHLVVYEFNGIKARDGLRKTCKAVKGPAKKWDYG